MVAELVRDTARTWLLPSMKPRATTIFEAAASAVIARRNHSPRKPGAARFNNLQIEVCGMTR